MRTAPPTEVGSVVQRDAVREALALLGVDASDSCLVEMVMEPWGITVSRYVTDPGSRNRLRDPDDESKAWIKKTFYPVED